MIDEVVVPPGERWHSGRFGHLWMRGWKRGRGGKHGGPRGSCCNWKLLLLRPAYLTRGVRNSKTEH